MSFCHDFSQFKMSYKVNVKSVNGSQRLLVQQYFCCKYVSYAKLFPNC